MSVQVLFDKWDTVAPLQLCRCQVTDILLHTLEIGLAFRTYPAGMDYLLHADKYIFSSSLQFLAQLPSD